MLVVFSFIFVADAKIICDYDFAAPLMTFFQIKGFFKIRNI